MPGVKYQLTTTGANSPLWSPDGKQISYFQAGSPPSLVAVDVRTQPTFAFANTTKIPIPNVVARPGGNVRPYDVTPDGKQFLIVTSGTQPSDASQQQELRVTLNWFEELKQRVTVP